MIFFILANLSFDMTDAKHLNCDSQSVSLCAHTNGQKYNHWTNGQAPRHKTFSEVLGKNTNRALAKRWLKAGLLSQILAQPCPDKYDSIRSFQEVMRKDRMGGFTQDLVKRAKIRRRRQRNNGTARDADQIRMISSIFYCTPDWWAESRSKLLVWELSVFTFLILPHRLRASFSRDIAMIVQKAT